METNDNAQFSDLILNGTENGFFFFAHLLYVTRSIVCEEQWLNIREYSDRSISRGYIMILYLNKAKQLAAMITPSNFVFLNHVYVRL